MYHVTRTADLYMHGQWCNVPPSRALSALPPVPVIHSVECARTHVDAVRGQPVHHVVQAGELLPLCAECSRFRVQLTPKSALTSAFGDGTTTEVVPLAETLVHAQRSRQLIGP